MGGYFSTRWDGHARRCTVEDALRLSTREIRAYLAMPRSVALEWHWSRGNERVAEVSMALGATSIDDPPSQFFGYRGDGSEGMTHPRKRRSLHLLYVVRQEGEPEERVEVETRLVALPMRFGGARWWLECPWCRSMRAALYLPLVAGGTRWRCRRCYGLRYRVQRLDPTARMEARMRRASERAHAGPWEHWFDFPPPKPKWMRHSTYARHVEEWHRASGARDAFCFAGMSALLARYDRARGVPTRARRG